MPVRQENDHPEDIQGNLDNEREQIQQMIDRLDQRINEIRREQALHLANLEQALRDFDRQTAERNALDVVIQNILAELNAVRQAPGNQRNGGN